MISRRQALCALSACLLLVHHEQSRLAQCPSKPAAPWPSARFSRREIRRPCESFSLRLARELSFGLRLVLGAVHALGVVR